MGKTQFEKPSGAGNTAFTLQRGSSAVAAMTFSQNRWAKIALVGEPGVRVGSTDEVVLLVDSSASSGANGRRTIELYGRVGGTAVLEARAADGSVLATESRF